MAAKTPQIIADIKPPAPAKKPENTDAKLSNTNDAKKYPHTSFVFLFVLISALILLAAAVNFKNAAAGSLQSIKTEFFKIKNAAQEMNIGEISKSLKTTGKEIKNLTFWSRVLEAIPGLKEISGTLDNLSLANEKTLAIAEGLDYLRKNAVQLAQNQKGGELIAALEKISENIKTINKLRPEIRGQFSQFKNLSPQMASFSNILEKNYFDFSLNLYKSEDFLDALIELLKQPANQHLLLLFQNESEIRPAGGFIGSYGDLTLSQGNLKDIRIDDIYNADRQLPLKIAPPPELLGITKTFGARDANWFFDFPTSAQKTAYLLEQSNLNRKNSIQFSGVIALNTKVLRTLISAAGPIELENYGLMLDNKNFLEKIQYEVEAGRDKKPGQNPKRILSAMMPILMEKLNNLSGAEKEKLIAGLQKHLVDKDIMIYFPDWRLQNFMELIGAAGEVIELDKNFSGDYLAVVNANIGGGKSDAFIDQHISLKSAVSPEGKIANILSVIRKHGGEKEKHWWYRAANKNYLKIFAPENSKLESPETGTVEKTGKESGKSYFASWFNVPAGKTKTLTVNYESGVRLNILPDQRFQFIFEKQSGVDGSLEYSISAPPGYIWKESGKPMFEYGTQQIEAREIINLTLMRI